MKTRPASCAFCFDIRRKNNPLAIWKVEGRKIRCAVRCDRSLVATVRIHHKHFKLPRFHQTLAEQFLVLVDLRPISRMGSPVDDSLTVWRKERPSIVADRVCKPAGIRTIDTHGVEVQVP